MDVLLSRTIRAGWILPLIVLLFSGQERCAGTEPALVQFDTAAKIACRPVDDETFRQANPGERLWEVQVAISAFIPNAQQYDDIEHYYVLRTSSREVLIEDYQPQTKLGSEYVGNIAHEEKSEFSRSLGVTIAGVQDCLVKASGSGELGKKDADTVRYELAPPQETLIASGTLHRGRAVYFKLRPAAQVTLEGAKDFTVILRAPDGWCVDTLQVGCQAIRRKRTILSAWDERITQGASEFVVALYAAGDANAKALAEEFVAADQQLRRAVNTFVRQSRSRREETLVRQLTTWIDPFPAAQAPAEVRNLLSGQARSSHLELNKLPEELRVPTADLLAVRERIETLRGGRRLSQLEIRTDGE